MGGKRKKTAVPQPNENYAMELLKKYHRDILDFDYYLEAGSGTYTLQPTLFKW